MIHLTNWRKSDVDSKQIKELLENLKAQAHFEVDSTKTSIFQRFTQR